MRSTSVPTAALLGLLLPAAHGLAGPADPAESLAKAQLDCANIEVDGQRFNLEELGGRHSVHLVRNNLPGRPGLHNTTFTIDLCRPLEQIDNLEPEFQCPSGTRVCATDRTYYRNGNFEITHVYPVAGDFEDRSDSLKPQWTLLGDVKDSKKAPGDGVRLTLSGGQDPASANPLIRQMALIDFVCDPDVAGDDTDSDDGSESDSDDKGDGDDEKKDRKKKPVEGGGGGDKEESKTAAEVAAEAESRDGRYVAVAALARRAAAASRDEKGPAGHDGGLDKARSLQLVSFEQETEEPAMKVLRLEWKTKKVCADREGGPGSSDSWGFFTWLIIIFFLSVSAYIIFSAYTRVGRASWDSDPNPFFDFLAAIPAAAADLLHKVIEKVRSSTRDEGYTQV